MTEGNFADTADFIIVGLGAAGAAGAIEARKAGLDVLVLERASSGGGSTAASGGYIYLGGGTRVQRANGIEDTVEAMTAYLMASCPEPDEAKIRAYCADSVSHFDWLEAQGVPFNTGYFEGKHVELETGETLSYTGNEKAHPFVDLAKPVPRGHRVAIEGQGGGRVLIECLTRAAEAAGVRFDYDANVQALLTDETGRVTGVRYRRYGEDFEVGARKGVLLATGGFAMNRAMIEEHCPFLAREDFYIVGGPYADGAGIRLGTGVGAATAHMDGALITSPIYPDEKLLKGILVNRDGRRFIPEDAYHARTTAAILEQPGMTAYLIVDNACFGRSVFGAQPLIDAWETVAEMEADLHMPEGSLQETVAAYNRHAAEGTDPEQHKQADWLQPLVEAPFAALDCSAGKAVFSGFTFGGLRTDEEARVLTADGTSIPGLFAAGAAASNLAQDSAGYASGICLGESTYFARRAAREAARA